jgi:hypothetical protein
MGNQLRGEGRVCREQVGRLGNQAAESGLEQESFFFGGGGEGRASERCIDLHSPVDMASCLGGFLKEHMRGLHDLLRQNPTSLFILLRWSSILMASLTV